MTEKAKPKVPKPKPPPRIENWADDQENRSYYYDDACGYETYDPQSEEDPEEDEPKELP